MTAPRLFFKQFNKNRFFVETGSCQGDGIQNAIDSGFAYIYSVELADYYYIYCQGRFHDVRNVVLVHGDSTKQLWRMIENIMEPITFWLDGHSSGGMTAKGEGYKIDGFPVHEELDIIAKHPIKTHTILIDDISNKIGDPNFCLDKWVHEICLKIKEINPEYRIRFERGAQKEGYILIAEV